MENPKGQFEAHRIPVRSEAEIGIFNCSRIGLLLVLILAISPLASRGKDATQYGAGLIVNIPLPEAEVVQAVQDVAQNGIIRGSKEYNKDEYVTGATAATSTPVFPEPAGIGRVFYKVKLKALDPQNFKDTNDVGTLAVRYIVQGQDDKHTVLRINARFLEDYRHISHASNGSVEGAEYQNIHDHLDAVELIKSGRAEAEKVKQEHMAKREGAVLTDESSSSVHQPGQRGPAIVSPPIMDPPAATNVDTQAPPPSPPPTLEQRVQDLRRQVERQVKSPGAPLKSAPFHTASTLQALPAGEQVLVEISTPYWLGVETHAGQHGWMKLDQLEPLP